MDWFNPFIVAIVVAIVVGLTALFGISGWLFITAVRDKTKLKSPGVSVKHDPTQQIIALLSSIDTSLAQIAGCVRHNHHSHGDATSLSTKHWND